MTDLLMRLSLATLTSSAAMLAVFALRQPVRRILRAQAAYALWALVPLATAAALMPMKVTTLTISRFQSSAVVSLHASSGPSAPESAPQAQSTADSKDKSAYLVGLWLTGMIATLALLVLQQRRFVRGLGRLSRVSANVRRAQTTYGCPALVGAWSPRIVLPVDFEQRYDAIERALILAHERHHRSHGDAQLNALCALLRSVFWFNPLIHFATAYFRLDQELACDAAIIRAFRGRRRSYARAMLKAQLPATGLPLGCHWPAGHALKERIRLLNAPIAGRLRTGLGAAAAVALVTSGAVAAWAAQPVHTEIHYAVDAPLAVADATPAIAEPAPPRDTSATEHAPTTKATQAVRSAAPNAPVEDGAPTSETARSKSTRPRSAPGSPSVAAADAAPRPSSANPSAQQTPAALAANAVPRAKAEQEAATDAPERTVAAKDAAAGNRPAEAIPSYRTRIPPVYPAAAVRMPGPSANSAILLRVDVDERGNPLGARVASMDPPSATELATASIAAVMQWQFDPALRDGKPVAGVAWVPFKFVLQGGATSPPLGEITDGSVAPVRRASYRTLTAIDYPRSDVLAGVEGVVYVKVRIQADGRIASLAVDRVEPESARPLANAAVVAMNTWTFNPARVAGRDIASSVTVPIVFTRQRERRFASNGHDYPGTLDPVLAIPKG